MKVFIDASVASASLRVFGMELVERLVRGVLIAGVAPTEILVVRRADGPAPQLPASLLARVPTRVEPLGGAVGERLTELLRGAEPVLVVSGNAIVDSRVFGYLAGGEGAVAFAAGDATERTVVARLEPGTPCEGVVLGEVLDRLIAQGALVCEAPIEFETYLPMLRRDLGPYAFRVATEDARRRTERFLFWSNYKGSTDFMTKYVYPPLVWLMVRPLARWRVHPNWVTAVDIVAAFAAVPFFALGAWVPGLLLGYLMTVLDSVDGKLARVTFTSSRLGEVLDHGLDIIHPPIWYLAWGWALGDGQSGSPPFQAALLMLAIYTVDRIIAGIFKWRLGRSIHGYTPFDERMRTFISRRNVNLVLFTLALAVDGLLSDGGWPVATGCWFAIVAWQSLCLVFHAQRLAHFWTDAR